MQETCSSELFGGQGTDFLRGVAFWSIKFSGLLRWFCVTGAALRMTWLHFFVASAILDRRRRSGNIAKRICTRLSALHSTFHFWRRSHRVASFLMLSTSKKEEVSQNCFVFDVIKFKGWGSLAELLRFWPCQVQKLRKSRRIAAFSSLQIDRYTDVKVDGSTQKPKYPEDGTARWERKRRYFSWNIKRVPPLEEKIALL